MKTKFGVVCCMTLLMAATCAHAQSKSQDVNDIALHLSSAITKSGKKTVAVVDFTDLQGSVTEFGRFLAEEFSVALAEDQGSFKVIDRTNLKIILQEHKLASTGIIDPQTARKLGEITGVQALVAGTITPFGETLRVSVKLLDSETAEIIAALTTDMPRTKSVEELLAKGLADEGKEHQPQTRSETQPVVSSSIQIGAFLYNIQVCQFLAGAEGGFGCKGTVVNKESKPLFLRIDLNESYAVDNIGTQSINKSSGYKLGYQIGSNNFHAGTVLDPEIPTYFWIGGRGLSDNAQSVTVVLQTEFGRGILRNLKLQPSRDVGK
jgi:TolB-like protein